MSPARAYGFGVNPSDLRLELCETDEQYHIVALSVTHRACCSALRPTRSVGEIRPYVAQRLELVCLT